MENTLEKKEVNTAYEELTSMDFGNSFDYTNDYYINSFDYILNVEDTIQSKHSKGCQVVSSGDSITIVHENGEEKHISNPPYECASDKYEANKAAKKSTTTKTSSQKTTSSSKPRTTDSLKKTTKPSQMTSVEKAKLQAKKAALKAKLEQQKATDSIYTEPYTHSKSDVSRQTTTATSTLKTTTSTTTTAQNSHDEVFGNTPPQTNSSGIFVKLFILLFIFFPIVSSIFTSCVAVISNIFD